MFKQHDANLRKMLADGVNSTQWNGVLEEHKRFISIIQHERLIHLLVTIFVGMIMSMSAFITIISQKPDLLIICIPLLILFIFYILHYRFLENTTQSWYLLEGDIRSRI